MKQAVQVTILGQQYTLRSDAPPEEVAKVVAFVNEKVAEVRAAGGGTDTLNAAVLALLNVAGAYLRLREGVTVPDATAEARLQQVLERLEQACPD